MCQLGGNTCGCIIPFFRCKHTYIIVLYTPLTSPIACRIRVAWSFSVNNKAVSAYLFSIFLFPMLMKFRILCNSLVKANSVADTSCRVWFTDFSVDRTTIVFSRINFNLTGPLPTEKFCDCKMLHCRNLTFQTANVLHALQY